MGCCGNVATGSGSRMLLLDLQGMRELLGREVDRAGGQTAWARRYGLHPSSINKVLHEQRLPGPKMLAALNLRKVIAYRGER